MDDELPIDEVLDAFKAWQSEDAALRECLESTPYDSSYFCHDARKRERAAAADLQTQLLSFARGATVSGREE